MIDTKHLTRHAQDIAADALEELSRLREENAELLAALRDARPYVRHSPFCAVTIAIETNRELPQCDCDCDKIRAAIAKAQGEDR